MSTRRYTQLGAARIHSVHSGTGSDVVLLHGLSGSRHWWRYTLEALAESYRVHVPELVGFGRSRAGWRQPNIGELAELMMQWLQELGLARPHLVGHSMGGQIALHMAASSDAALRTLSLVCASGIPRAFGLGDAARMLAGALPPRRWGATGFLPTIALDALRSGPRRLAHAGWNLLGDDVRPLLPRIKLPCLVVWGALDPLLPLEHGRALADGLPDARLVVLANAAHNPMADEPREFNRVLLDFLDRHE
ncbi:MAG TPA: alpha/beta fold hydrolase [Longimicrobiales bacterium]|nr:alpha/beta fold hydrolase [Longimicrobiales bacterium]